MGIVLTLGECTAHVLYLEVAGVEGGRRRAWECTAARLPMGQR